METSTTFIRWAIVILANHVSVQERLHNEIDSVVGRERPPTLVDKSRPVRQISLCCCNLKSISFFSEIMRKLQTRYCLKNPGPETYWHNFTETALIAILILGILGVDNLRLISN